MAVLLALASAALWGASDFCGGLASRRSTAYAVVIGSQAIGLLALFAVLPAIGGAPTATDLAWGAAAGVCGSTGLVVFYRAMASGVMSVVASARLMGGLQVSGVFPGGASSRAAPIVPIRPGKGNGRGRRDSG